MKELNLIPTYQEFIKEYEMDERVSMSYQWENETWDRETSIGCGNNKSKICETVEKMGEVGAKIAITKFANNTLLATTGGVGNVVLGGVGYANGLLIEKLGEKTKSPKIAKVGELLKDISLGVAIGGVIDNSSQSLISQGTKSLGHHISREIATEGMSNSVNLLIATGKTIAQLTSELRDIEEIYGIVSDSYEIKKAYLHGKHLDMNIDYLIDCPVCQSK